jgi:UDPglucose 6-dehydrogenase
VIPTDWNAFRSPNFAEIGTLMKAKRIVDGRNLYEPKVMAAAGFDYHCIGRPHIPPATV